MPEADQRERRRIVQGENKTKGALPTYESTDGVIDLTGKRPHHFAARGRNPIINRRDHPVPVVDEIAGNDGGYHNQRKGRDQLSTSRPCRAQECANPAGRQRGELANRTLGLARPSPTILLIQGRLGSLASVCSRRT